MGKSKCLRWFYGREYEDCLEFYIKFGDASRSKVAVITRVVALSLIFVNIVMSCWLFPLRALVIYPSNWNMLLTFLCVAMSAIYAHVEMKNMRLLALLHILLELCYVLNFVILTFYWSLIHLAVINKFQGAERIHMYLIHSLPGIAFY